MRTGFKVRGKLTIHFEEPQPQTSADEAADRCATVAVALLREATDHEGLIGFESSLSAELFTRYPRTVAAARSVEIAALHVVGEPGLSGELRRSSNRPPSMAPGAQATPNSLSLLPPTFLVGPPPSMSASLRVASLPTGMAAPAASPPPVLTSMLPPPSGAGIPSGPMSSPGSGFTGGPGSGSVPSNPSTMLPSGPSSVPPPGISSNPPSRPPSGPRRRIPSVAIRSAQSLRVPMGTPPSNMGSFLGPFVRDSGARLLVGFLRAHDLSVLRGGIVDEISAETLANLVPTTDAPVGGYASSREAEIHRWQSVLGESVIRALHHEAELVCIHLVWAAMLTVEVPPATASAVVESLCQATFVDMPGERFDFSRYPDPSSPDFVPDVAENLTRFVHRDAGDALTIARALASLIGLLHEDLVIVARIVKLAGV